MDDDQIEIFHEKTAVQDTQSLLDCHENNLKSLHDALDEDDILAEYLTELNRGSLYVVTLSTVFFVHSKYQAHSKISLKRQRCRSYFKAFV